MHSLAETVEETCLKAVTVNHVKKNPKHNKTVQYIVSIMCEKYKW